MATWATSTTIEMKRNARLRKRKRPPLGVGGRHFTGLTSVDNTPTPQNPEAHRRMIARLQAKQRKVGARYAHYEYISNRKADTLVVCFGSLSRAVMPLADRYAIFRPILLYPPIREFSEIKAYEVVVVEMNAGQYVRVVQRLMPHRPLARSGDLMRYDSRSDSSGLRQLPENRPAAHELVRRLRNGTVLRAIIDAAHN